MDENTFDLLTKLYSEFSDFRKEVNTKLDKKTDKSDIARLEHEHGQKLDALFDGYKQSYEKLEVIEDMIGDLTDKVNRHDVKIQVIEGGRK